jgi:hypothetical protein
MFKRILILGTLLLSACASASPAPTDSGVEGRVLIGPMCPVVQVGQECPDEPYQATLTINSPTGERIVQVQTKEDGTFKIPLAPGDYILHPESPNVMPTAQDQPFSVEAGKFTQVTVNYDSGIR